MLTEAFKAVYGCFCIKLVFILPKTKTHGIDYSEIFIRGIR